MSDYYNRQTKIYTTVKLMLGVDVQVVSEVVFIFIVRRLKH